jgi:rhodanese-related sulfurtransferase
MKQRINNFEYSGAFEVKTRTSQHMALVFTSLLSLMFCNKLLAQETPNLAKPKIIVPDQMAGTSIVNAEQVIEALSSQQPPMLIDARIYEDRQFGFIESSISLPDIETNCQTLHSKVSSNKKQPLMFYCNGVQCGRSVVAIKVARSCGYHNLSWFRGGFAEWKDKGYQYITK